MKLVELVNRVAEAYEAWDPDPTVTISVVAAVIFLVPLIQAIWWVVR